MPAVISANPENPYAPPSDPESIQGQPQHRSPLIQALLMFPFAVIAGAASGHVAVIGTVLGALCVAIVNGLPWIPSINAKLYWTTFAWQFLMLEYLIWLSNNRQVSNQQSSLATLHTTPPCQAE